MRQLPSGGKSPAKAGRAGKAKANPSQVSEPKAGCKPYICAVISGSAVTDGKGSPDGFSHRALILKPDPA